MFRILLLVLAFIGLFVVVLEAVPSDQNMNRLENVKEDTTNSLVYEKIDRAISMNQRDKLNDLLDQSSDAEFLNYALVQSCAFGNQSAFLEVAKRGIDIHYRDEQTGRNLIHYAALMGEVDMILFLIQFGVDPDAEARNQMTPLEQTRFRLSNSDVGDFRIRLQKCAEILEAINTE